MSLSEVYGKYIKLFEEKCRRSRELYNRACRVLPAGVTYSIRFYEPYPFYVARAKGCKVYDVDGNVYTDYWIGHGALILGHAHDEIVKAVAKQLELSSHYGYAHELEVELAELIVKHVPNVEMVRFTNSGTEANMYSARLVRAYTKRKKLVKFEGGWHGGYDSLHTGVTPPYRGPESAGVPDELIANTIVAPFNDIEGVEKIFREHGNEIAGVFIEPVMGAGGAIPANRDFLKALRELCDKYGSLLVFDEVITGFRLGLGGSQEYFNVKADVVVMGKIIGGGFPIGAFASRREVMEKLDHLKYRDKLERSFHGGTFTGNPVSMIAGITTIKVLEKTNAFEYLNSLGKQLMVSLMKVIEEHRLRAYVTGEGSIIGVHFTVEYPRSAVVAQTKRWSEEMYSLLHKFMLVNGIAYMTEHTVHFLLSTAHTSEDIKYLAEKFSEFLDLVKPYVPSEARL